MRRLSLVSLVGLAVIVSWGTAWGQSGVVSEESATITLTLPEGGEGRDVDVEIGQGGLSILVPNGTKFPVDFEAASGGLLKAVDLTRGDDGSMLLELRINGGLISGVGLYGEELEIRVRRRYSAADAVAEGQDDYRLGPDDKVLVTVGGHPDLTQQLVVKRNGAISVQLVGDVRAAGRTVQELGGQLAELLAQDFLVDPQVDVQVLEYNSQWVLVTGEVNDPGRVPLRGGTNLKEAIADAGGLSARAGNRILISQGGSEAGEEPAKVDRDAFELGSVNPRLSHGDIVSVPQIAFLYVRGEVRNPSRVPAEPGMTLMKALSLVGGLTEWADRKDIQIIREGEAASARSFNLKRIESGRVADPKLTGGEIIIVKRRFL